MSDQLTETQIQSILYSINRRAGKSDDELDYDVCDLLDHYAARIADLEAQLEALRNPPYRIEIIAEDHYEDYRAVVMRGDVEIMVFDFHPTEAEARAEAQQFIDKLTAPFGAKGE